MDNSGFTNSNAVPRHISAQPPASYYPPSHVGPSDHSKIGIIRVLSYNPCEGEPDVPVIVYIHFHYDAPSAVFVRLLVGDRPVKTTVREESYGPFKGSWMLESYVPLFSDRLQSTTRPITVPLSVQALKGDEIIDTVYFGNFTFWIGRMESLSSPRHAAFRDVQDTVNSRRSTVASEHPESDSNRRRRPRTLTSPCATTRNHPLIHRRMKSRSSTRSQNGGRDGSFEHTPILELVTPLDSICANWTPAERAAGRRLVAVQRVLEGPRMMVIMKPISQEGYRNSDSVISCIYHEQSGNYYVTSVDIIYLLENLAEHDFVVEEKNRIRRNLEGLRPTTVSKSKPGFESFFQLIMDFPDPKPRNIEKDLKVFEWGLLGQALEKILSKYVINYSQDAPSYHSTPSPLSATHNLDAAPPPRSRPSSMFYEPTDGGAIGGIAYEPYGSAHSDSGSDGWMSDRHGGSGGGGEGSGNLATYGAFEVGPGVPSTLTRPFQTEHDIGYNGYNAGYPYSSTAAVSEPEPVLAMAAEPPYV